MIELRYFAWVRERVGVAGERVETSAATVRELVEELRARDAAHAFGLVDLGALMVALYLVLAVFVAPLAGGREVAFFPPWTGGCG
jgi:molybdopterin synthase sulfur carrier subunit